MWDMIMFNSFEDVVSSVRKIRFNDKYGSCTVMRIDDIHIGLLTCRHIFDDVKNGDRVSFSIDVFHNSRDMCGSVIASSNIKDDCVIIVVENSENTYKSPREFNLPIHSCIGDEVFVLGFPFLSESVESQLIGDMNDFFQSAWYRRGYVSAEIMDHTQQVRRLMLDLYSNHGFSGAPVCVQFHYPNKMDNKVGVIGVLGGCYNESTTDELLKINSHFAYANLLDDVMSEFYDYKRVNKRNDS